MNQTPITRIGELIEEVLTVRPFRLMGCARRNYWRTAWRSDVGAAVMQIAGTKQTVVWMGDPVDVFVAGTKERVLLLWRAGPWQGWWTEDAFLLAGMVNALSEIHATGVVVLHEVDGQTRTAYVETPERDAKLAYERTMDAWTQGMARAVPPRIRKNSERANRWCRRCPVRKRCDLLDIEHGEMGDWNNDRRAGK